MVGVPWWAWAGFLTFVATMLAHGVRHLGTRNAADFKRYESLISIESVAD